MRRLILFVVPLALAACNHKETQETQTTVTKDGVTTTTITDRTVDRGSARRNAARGDNGATASALSIDSDDFKANVEIPGLTFDGGHADLDGMKLYPGSTVTGMHVHATDHGSDQKGSVVMNYSSPAAPATVAQHMADEARRAGYTLTSNTVAMVGGTKRSDAETKSFSMTLAPNDKATVGAVTMSGSEH